VFGNLKDQAFNTDNGNSFINVIPSTKISRDKGTDVRRLFNYIVGMEKYDYLRAANILFYTPGSLKVKLDPESPSFRRWENNFYGEIAQ